MLQGYGLCMGREPAGKGQDGSNEFESLGRIWRFPATAIFDLNNACVVDICQV